MTDDEFEEEHFEEKPFLEHLEDLRTTLFKIIIATVVGTTVCLAVSKQIFSALTGPIRQYASIVSDQKPSPVATKDKAPAAVKSTRKPKPEQPVTPPPTRIVITGPYAGIFFLAWDAFVCSREALLLFTEGTLRPPPPEEPKKQPAEPAKASSPKKKKTSPKKEDELVPVRLIVTGPTKGFMLVIKTAFLCGLAGTMPLNIFFLAQFVFPALTRKEKRYVTPSFLIGGVLFVIGLFFGYFITLPLALKIFIQINQRYGLENVWRMSEYLETVTKLLIANGVIFEMPLLLTVLVRIGVLSVRTLKKKRRHAIVAILFVAALLSPPDPATMFMLAVPMVVMYEACIWASWLLMRKRRKREEEEERRESYWEERKRIRHAAHVEPKEEPKEHTTPEQTAEQGDYGRPPEDYGEEHGHKDQGDEGKWTYEDEDQYNESSDDVFPSEDPEDPYRQDGDTPYPEDD
jgi:sec-independent protein translocase protein TatC